ncbi:MAG: AI-2E family transporter [Burkholderiales bacterium]
MIQNNFKIKPIISLLIALLAIFTIIILVGKVLIPFLVALILTYIVNPLVEKIQNKLRIKRSIISFTVSLIMFILFLALPLLIIPTLAIQIKAIITKVPDLITLFNQRVLGGINYKYGTNLALDFDNIKTLLLNNIDKIYNHVNLFSPLAKNSMVILEIALYIILIPFILFYSIIEWHRLVQFFDSLIPRGYRATVHLIINDIDRMLAAYLRGQISVMLIMAGYYAIGLHIVGLASGIIIGIVTGLLVFVPYLGILAGLLISLSIGFAGFTNMHQIIAILIVFVIGHILEGGLVTPFLVGGKIGLNPVMIILALMIFGKLFGFVGILLALPLSTITVVLLKYAKRYYLNSKYYNEDN